MKRSNAQSYISMASALVMFIGGMTITVFFPGSLSDSYRWVIGLFVAFYFILRMAQAIMMIRRNRLEEKSNLHELIQSEEE